jgi:hypothetical protein
MDELDRVHVTSHKEFKQHFNFPEVAKNDYSTEKLGDLEIAENNFNADLENSDLLNTFIAVGNQVKKDLKEKYGDQWTDPADGDVPNFQDD